MTEMSRTFSGAKSEPFAPSLMDELADRLAYIEYLSNVRNPPVSFARYMARRAQPVAEILNRAPDLVADLELADQETAVALQRGMRQAQEGTGRA